MCRRSPLRHAFRASVTCAAATTAVLAAAPLSFAESSPGTGVTPPVVVQHVDAVYPPSALGERKHADVVLTVTVDADGHVSKVDVAQSGGADLDEAAVVAARQWTFVPAMRDGKPLASRIKMPFHFAPPAPPPEILAPAPREPELPVTPAIPQETPPTGVAPTQPPVTGGPSPAPASEEVDVHGRAAPPNVGASDFNIHIGALAAVPHENASELLKLAPGILLTNEGGEGHADQVFLRGFDAEQGQAIEFTVDGVPINEGLRG